MHASLERIQSIACAVDAYGLNRCGSLLLAIPRINPWGTSTPLCCGCATAQLPRSVVRRLLKPLSQPTPHPGFGRLQTTRDLHEPLLAL